MTPAAPKNCFNPVLGFLSVSTCGGHAARLPSLSFNPVLGFLSVSTVGGLARASRAPFQSRAGFSECLDEMMEPRGHSEEEFQSRAGFSECLDTR